jgi:hypothetical protein
MQTMRSSTIVYSFPHGAFGFLAESDNEVLVHTFAAMMDVISSSSKSLNMLLMFLVCTKMVTSPVKYSHQQHVRSKWRCHLGSNGQQRQ